MSLNDEGLVFYYGNFTHRVGEVYPRQIQVRPLFTSRGLRWASEHRMEIAGDLISPTGGPLTKAEIAARIDQLNEVYKYDYRNCGWRQNDGTLTPHRWLTDDVNSLSGTQVVYRSWDNVLPTEYVNTRSFTVVLRNLFLETYSNILDFRETVEQIGTGGPLWKKYNLWNGAPQVEFLSTSSKVRYIQKGTLVGLSGYETIPPPWWPNDEQQWRRVISSSNPRFHGHPSFTRGTHYVKTYAYFFELSAAEFQNPNSWLQ